MTLTNSPGKGPGTRRKKGEDAPGMAIAPGLRARRAGVSDDPQRDLLIVEVVDEITAWNPRDRMKAFRSWLKGSLSLVHLHVLTILEAEGPIAMSRLADMLDVSVASATGIVSRMEERGFVQRRHDEEDRRVVLVVPTESGASVFREMLEQRREHLRTVLGQVAEVDLKALLSGLRAVRKARESLHAADASDETAGETR